MSHKQATYNYTGSLSTRLSTSWWVQTVSAQVCY